MSYDITFCGNKNCKNKECERNQVNMYVAGSYYTGRPIWIGEFKKCEYWEDKQ